MSRISKELASQIAYKLTEKSRLAADKLHSELREQITELYEEQTPSEVKTVYKKHPEWFYTRSEILLDGHGFNHQYYSPTRKVIANGQRNGNAILRLTTKSADQLFKLKTKWERATSKYKELKQEAESALLALKTFNNIRKELPEAAPMLPPPMSNALVVNFDSLKKKLNQQPTVSAEKEKVK